ncbi:MAG TPA: hypothetical protein VJ576_03440 [Rhodocyclaceae bacterium]|nr:hypothetical protein [Rhodocyclaceae bacterium]
MKIATTQHLDAFNRATQEIMQRAPQLEAMTLGALAVVEYNTVAGNLDGALAAGVVSLEHGASEFQRLLGQFQKAAADLMGEHPAPGETPVDFFGRIYRMGAEGWFALARKNGIRLAF